MPEALEVRLPAGARRGAVLAAAHALSPLAHAVVATRGGAPALLLTPRRAGGGAGLEAEARRVHANMELRWALAERSAAPRSELVRRMLGLARKAAARPQAAASLPPEALAEQQAVLAETGDWEKDPRGIKTSWSDLRRR